MSMGMRDDDEVDRSDFEKGRAVGIAEARKDIETEVRVAAQAMMDSRNDSVLAQLARQESIHRGKVVTGADVILEMFLGLIMRAGQGKVSPDYVLSRLNSTAEPDYEGDPTPDARGFIKAQLPSSPLIDQLIRYSREWLKKFKVI